MKCIPLKLLVISILSLGSARQILFSRSNTRIIEDTGDILPNSKNKGVNDKNEVEATVREIKLVPYSSSGFRPAKAFTLPNETTTQEYRDELTTASYFEGTDFNEDNNSAKVRKIEKAPYPSAGFHPSIPFLLPIDDFLKSSEISKADTTKISDETKIKAPYPAAGFRPSKPFLLPLNQLKLEDVNKTDNSVKTGNSNNPACGSSTNPLAPKPLDGTKEDPDSEAIDVNVTKKRNY